MWAFHVTSRSLDGCCCSGLHILPEQDAKGGIARCAHFLVSNLRKSWQTSYVSLTRVGSHDCCWTLTGKEEQDGQDWLRHSRIYLLGLGEGVALLGKMSEQWPFLLSRRKGQAGGGDIEECLLGRRPACLPQLCGAGSSLAWWGSWLGQGRGCHSRCVPVIQWAPQ